MTPSSPAFSPQRRRLLASGVAAAVAAALNPSAVLGAAPLVGDRGAALVALTSTLFPLAVFGEAHHAAAAARIAERCAADPRLDELVERALAALPSGWMDGNQAAREATLRAKADPALLKLARQNAVGALFGAPDTWAHFGYPGPSLPFGGYLDSKLVDLPWLTEAST